MSPVELLDPALGDAVDGPAGEVPLSRLAALALEYVALREATGCLNHRSASQVRSRLLAFAAAAPDEPAKLRQRHVERWLADPAHSPAYRRGRLSTVRGFCKWLVGRGYLRSDPTLLVEPVKVPEALPKRLTGAEARSVVSACPDKRTLLVVLLMLQEGLRRVEVSRLNVEDVDFAERAMVVRGKGGRGRGTDALPISSETWMVLVDYLAESGHTHGPLVRNKVRPHGRLSANTVSELVRCVLVASGVKRPGDATRTPHSLRHTCAHDLLTRTRDIRAVQQALRHRSVRSTEIYLRGHVTELREVMEGRSYRSVEPLT